MGLADLRGRGVVLDLGVDLRAPVPGAGRNVTHGMPTTEAPTINADLLAFLQS